MAKINPELIESYRVFRKYKPWDFSVRQPFTIKKLFRPNVEVPKRVRKTAWNDVFFSIEEFEEAYKDIYYIENDAVYEYPYVEIKVASGRTHKRRFKTEAELDDFIKANLSHVKI